MENTIVLEAKSIFKSFYDPVQKEVLKDISFDIHRGEFVSVMGRSGCGKSSLLYILSTMDTDYTGELYIDQELVTNQSDQALASLRNEKIGFVFQFQTCFERQVSVWGSFCRSVRR